MAFELPALPYAFDALEPSIDAQTVELHYTKHHNTYLTNMNNAFEKHPRFFDMRIEDILRDLNQVPEEIRTVIRNNGGGFYNHNIYWAIMGPNKGGQPTGRLSDAINQAFGSFESLKGEVEKAGMGRFGSGWAWLSKKNDGDWSFIQPPIKIPLSLKAFSQLLVLMFGNMRIT
jgi:superoxide dismutase, Fe-Mn family